MAWYYHCIVLLLYLCVDYLIFIVVWTSKPIYALAMAAKYHDRIQAEIVDLSVATTVEHVSIGVLQIACFEARRCLDYE